MTRSANDVLDQEFLIVRSKLLEVAAFFDRFEEARSHGQESGDVNQRHLDLLNQGSRILTDGLGDKAARLQLLFSRGYEPEWREAFEV